MTKGNVAIADKAEKSKKHKDTADTPESLSASFIGNLEEVLEGLALEDIQAPKGEFRIPAGEAYLVPNTK